MTGSQTQTEPGLATNLAHKAHVFKLTEEEENPKTSICCLQGCIAASVVGFSFFVALPTGIILIVLSTNSNDKTLLAVGCVLITLPVIILIIVISLCMNQKRLCFVQTHKEVSKKPQMQVIQTTASSREYPV